MRNQENANQHAVRTRSERGAIVASIAGHQAPLGYNNNAPAELWNEISSNNGSARMRRKIIRNVSVEHRDAFDVGGILEMQQ